jgi:hypothetical protein
MIELRTRKSFAGGIFGAGLGLLGATLVSLTAGVPGARAQGASAAAARLPVTQRLVFGHYYYSFQGDPRKPVTPRGVRDRQGLSQMTHHPWESVGPWMSFDRAQWHKNQFQMMAAGGIDVALAVYRGDRASRRAYALKGLDVLTQGLKELRAESKGALMKAREFPQIGLALDLTGLSEQYGGPVDLTLPDVQRDLYGMVRDFYLHIPEEFRATVQLPPSRLATVLASSGARPAQPLQVAGANTPQGAAYVVRLIGDSAVKNADASVLGYVNRRFAQEFGTRLVWVGTPALKARIAGLDAVAPYPAADRPAVLNSDGWIRTGSFGPGHDDSWRGKDAVIRPRENGQQTIVDFRKILDASPDWVFIDSWNGYGQGSDIAPTLEYGLLYRDLVRAGVLQFKQSGEYAADVLKAAAPRMIQPRTLYQVDVVVQNSGTVDWDPLSNISLTYRWLKNGKPIGDPTSQVAAKGHVRGESRAYVLGVAAPMEQGRPVAGGAYELEISMVRRSGKETKAFEQGDRPPFRIPVTVGEASPSRGYWVSSTMHTLTRRGATYPARIRVRNDGSDTWKRGVAALAHRWRKVSTHLKGASEDGDTVVAEGARTLITRDVEPGEILDMEVPVTTSDSQGAPLQTWSSQEDWVYVLEWDLHDGQRLLSQAGGNTYREPVEVLDRDPAPYFVGCNLGSDLVAGRTEKITIGLVNNGPDVWKRDREKVIVHWYYMDGTEAAWNDDSLPLDRDVVPFSRVETLVPVDPDEEPEMKPDGKKGDKGKREKAGREKRKARKELLVQPTVLRDVPVRVPYYFGPMYCVFDFSQDGLLASTSSASKGNDILVVPVNIFSPTFTPLPIQAYYNVDGVSPDVDRADGDIDGQGNSLPAEVLPPYVPRPSVGENPAVNAIYPSGLWVRPLNDLEGSRACFIYPNKNNKTPNMIRSEGQQLQFPGQPRSAVHILAVCTEEDVSADFLLTYADGSSEKKRYTFTHWNQAPKHGERVGFSTAHRHTVRGDDAATRCYVNHYVIATDRLKPLIGVELPRLPALKVVAITLEASTLGTN